MESTILFHYCNNDMPNCHVKIHILLHISGIAKKRTALEAGIGPQLVILTGGKMEVSADEVRTDRSLTEALKSMYVGIALNLGLKWRISEQWQAKTGLWLEQSLTEVNNSNPFITSEGVSVAFASNGKFIHRME